ncbi:hypothetical protein BATDEDRAFT_87857 [Batrachochytrium dendrobatidis JAM81]|uniref:Testis-expressed sequence 9 protein n=2 Tax=Batrachochytrium dendrobatidis TaxID=109871 RepID=F4NZP9_BATDJ|nr:uncharacterized protein BATDEDRAFT_87857 [Batrachochytrium dendrobatidis JAM81]EGF81222.1 hypothetical protein BATDEDRAFT_87857 [Batrachochytrium dendrobatidis JAM81]OAJ38266.1 hypothetical protein BDEG_22215 [Batrachochytrium dendrobatidis JEL423]|eukprot:XP_006678127.1 hypothetical protein BATDEDRAFT_87857 [Batrachochytrium dendrobatidis JAM81]
MLQHDSEDEQEYQTGLESTCLVSADLLEQEKAFRKKNKELKSQTKQVLQQANDVVKEGRCALERPTTAPTRLVSKSAPVNIRSKKLQRSDSASNVDMAERSKIFPSTEKLSNQNDEPVSEASKLIPGLINIDQTHIMMGLPKHINENSLGLEATNRFLKAKIQVLQKELESVVQIQNEKDAKHVLTLERLKLVEEESSKMQKALDKSEDTSEKLRVLLDKSKNKYEASELDLQRVKKEMDNANKVTRQTANEVTTRDLKLNRALEELDKCRSILARQEGDAKEKIDVAKRTAEALFAENKKLQKQKSELLTAFKKQAQLVTILKRQKMHVESVKLLQFTEDEFVRALNWDL